MPQLGPEAAKNILKKKKKKRFPRDIHILIPGTCEYFTLCGEWDFIDVIKLRTLRRKDYLGLSRWAHSNHKDPYRSARVREKFEDTP